MKVGLVLGAGGVLGGAWLVGGLSALARETDWDPGSADHIVGTSAGSMIGALVAGGIPPWFMVAHSRGEVFEGLVGPDGRPAADADRSAGASFRLHRGVPAIGPGSLRMAFTALSNPLRHTPLQMVAGWVPSGFMSTDSLKETVARAVPGDWVEHPNYWAVACDYESGRRTPFGRLGSPRAHIGDAVAASCAIPGFYRPVKIGEPPLRGRGRLLGLEPRPGGRPRPRPRDLPEPAHEQLRGARLGRRHHPRRHGRDQRRARPHPLAHAARLARAPGARGAQGAPLRHRGRRDRAHRRGPRRDGPQLDEHGAPPARDRDRRGDGRGAARRPELRALLEGLPAGEPHRISRPSGPPSTWPELRSPLDEPREAAR